MGEIFPKSTYTVPYSATLPAAAVAASISWSATSTEAATTTMFLKVPRYVRSNDSGADSAAVTSSDAMPTTADVHWPSNVLWRPQITSLVEAAQEPIKADRIGYYRTRAIKGIMSATPEQLEHLIHTKFGPRKLAKAIHLAYSRWMGLPKLSSHLQPVNLTKRQSLPGFLTM